MKVLPIRNPKCVNLALKGISEETTIFQINVNEFVSNPGGREDAEQLFCQAKSAIMSWRDQLNIIIRYVEQDLTPK